MKEENDAMKFTFCKSFPFVLLAAFALPAVAQDLEWELVNDTQSDLVEMYTSPANMGTWREDILGNNVLPAGQAGTVTIFDGQTECEYDMRFVFDDGSEMVDTVNVCELGSYRLYE
jgi:hypothetical protein